MCPLLELCKCDGTHVCLFCGIVTVCCMLALCFMAGYFIGKKKGGKSISK